MRNIAELKQAARADVRAASPKAWLMTLVYLALTAGLSYAVGLFASDPVIELVGMYQSGLTLDRALLLALQAVGGTGVFLNLLLLLTGIVFDFGYSQWCLGTVRGGIGEFSDLLGGFALTGRVLLLRVMTLLYCFMWYVVIFVPAGLLVMLAMAFPLFGPLLVPGVFVAALVLYLWRILGYAMAPYCLMDEPDMGVTHALRESRRLMWHQVGRLVLLLLSFLGWHLLGAGIGMAAEWLLVVAGTAVVHVLGLGTAGMALVTKVAVTAGVLAAWPLYLWLTPYMTMAQCRFYDALKNPEAAEQF